ncbi:MAG: hypothetical protein HON70_19145, partial [Lentisphaerae bacterium]|nr:hypothetical protein [Lentisphaerota bacterium]
MSEMRNALLIVALVVAATCSTSALEVTNATHGAALSGTTATISGGFSFTGTESFTIVYSLPEGWAYAHNGVASSGSPVFAFNDGGDELSCFFFGTPMSPFTFSFGVTLPAADSAGTISGKVQYTDAQGHPQPDVPIGTALSFPADTHTVTFELGAHGTHNGGGALTQVVAHGTGAVAPAVDAADGWDHTGWDTDFASVTSPLAVTALYAAWPTVATPVFDPLSGAAIPDGGLDVTITCATDGAVIWYTTDGSVPEMNGSTSTQYTATFHIDDTATLKAGAFKTGMTPSAVATAVYTGDGLVLTVENTAGLAGEEVILPITVQEFADVSTFQFSVHWPVSVGTYVGVEAFGVPGLLAGNFGTDEAGTGTLSVSWDDPEGNTETLPDDSVLFGIRVRLAGEPGTSGNAWLDGSPTAVEVTDADVLPLPVSLAPGTLSVRDVVAIGGTCTYYGDDETVADVTVDLAGAESDSLQTGTDGTYHFSNVPVDGDYTVTPTKSTDTPLRNGVTTADISLIRRHILAITPLNAPEKLLAADVNRSDAVTTADIALIRRFILAISDTLPGGLWRFVPSDTVYADSRVPWGAPEARSYTGLQADMFDQDFTAIRLGDVNSSWTAPTDGGRGGDTSPAATRDAAVTFAVSDDVANAGEPVTVDVAVSDFVAVTSVQCTVQWDPAVLTYVSTGDYGLAGLAGGNFG